MIRLATFWDFCSTHAIWSVQNFATQGNSCRYLTQRTNKRKNHTKHADQVARNCENIFRLRSPLQRYTGFHASTILHEAMEITDSAGILLLLLANMQKLFHSRHYFHILERVHVPRGPSWGQETSKRLNRGQFWEDCNLYKEILHTECGQYLVWTSANFGFHCIWAQAQKELEMKMEQTELDSIARTAQTHLFCLKKSFTWHDHSLELEMKIL